jgi:DNA-binding IscR family transcriptional regulator
MATLVSRKTDYAMLILSHLADRPAGGSAREIAERFVLSKGTLPEGLPDQSPWR